MVAYFHADDAGADHREAARQAGDLHDLVTVEHAGAVERHAVGAMRSGADGDQNALALEDADVAGVRGDLDAMRVEEARGADGGLHRVAGELVFQHIDLVVERHVQARHQVLGGDVLLHPVGAAVEATLAPAGEVEHGLPHRLRRDGAGVDRDAADAAALLHHEDGAAELRGLDGGAAAGGAAADDDEVEGAHGRGGCGRKWRRVYRNRGVGTHCAVAAICVAMCAASSPTPRRIPDLRL